MDLGIEQPTQARRTGGRSARVRESVLAATIAILQDQRVPTVDEVARQAGVQKTSIYRRWGSLEGLVFDAVQARARQSIGVPDTGCLRDDLLHYLRAGLAFHRSPFGALVTRMGVHAPAPLRQAYWRDRLAEAARIIERARGRGEIGPGVDGAFVIEMAVAPIYLRTLVTGAELEDGLPERVTHFILAALDAPGGMVPSLRAVGTGGKAAGQ